MRTQLTNTNAQTGAIATARSIDDSAEWVSEVNWHQAQPHIQGVPGGWRPIGERTFHVPVQQRREGIYDSTFGSRPMTPRKLTTVVKALPGLYGGVAYRMRNVNTEEIIPAEALGL